VGGAAFFSSSGLSGRSETETAQHPANDLGEVDGGDVG